MALIKWRWQHGRADVQGAKNGDRQTVDFRCLCKIATLFPFLWCLESGCMQPSCVHALMTYLKARSF